MGLPPGGNLPIPRDDIFGKRGLGGLQPCLTDSSTEQRTSVTIGQPLLACFREGIDHWLSIQDREPSELGEC